MLKSKGSGFQKMNISSESRIILLRIRACRCASDRVSLIAVVSPTERAIQSRLSGTTPESSHGWVLNHTTAESTLCPRATGSIAKLSIYLIIRTGKLLRDRTSAEACWDTNRLSGSFRSGITERCIITRPRLTRFYYRLFHNQLYSECNMAVQFRGK